MENTKIATPFLTLILLMTFCVSIHAIVRHPETMTETLPAYAIAGLHGLLNSSRCGQEMQKFHDAVNHGVLWSLRMLDASGEPYSGFINGNNYWLGDRQQCGLLATNVSLMLSEKVARNNSIYRNTNEEFPPFAVQFFVAHMRHNSTVQYHVETPEEDLVTLGLCLPASCTLDEVATTLTKVLDDRTLLYGQLYSADFRLIDVSDMKDNHQWLLSGKIITIILVLILLASLAIVGTMYDILVYQKRVRRKQKVLTLKNNNISEMKHDMEEKCEGDTEEAGISDLKPGKPESGIGQALLRFSFYSNIQRIFKVYEHSDDVPALHGLKFLTMTWIIIVHTFFYGYYIFANRISEYLTTDTFEKQVVLNGTLSVDTFFFISGFLLSYVFLKAQQQAKRAPRFQTQVQQFFFSVVKRFIRLTPSYYIVILIAILNFSWLESISLFHYAEPVNNVCSKYWWRNILFINNLFEFDSLCLSWSWYLSNDMQFFIFGSFLLLLSATHYFIALGIGLGALILSILLNGYFAYSIGYTLTMNEQYATLTILYVRPWLRIPPYLIGIGVAQLLSKWNYKLHLSKKALIVCWTLGIMCNCLILFGILHKPIPFGLSILYTALSRTGWAIGLGWLVVACCTNNAGMVNKFLSLPMWVPLSRLTYCVYLLNPLIIISIYMLNSYPLFVETLTTGAMSFGLIMISYVCAIPLSLVTEVPAIMFLRVLSSKKSAK